MRKRAATATLWTIGAAAVIGIGILCVRHEMDFQVYYAAATRALHGEPDLFELDSPGAGLAYRYAPVIALLISPLTLFPVPVAGFIWYLLKVAALAVTVRIAVRMAGSCDLSEAGLFGVGFLLTGGYLIEEMATGNMHLLAMSCLVVAFYGIEQRRVAAASFCLALSILAKVTPAIVLPYLAIRRQWRVLGGTLAVIVGVSLAPSFVVGHDTNMRWLGDWGRTVLARVEPGPNERDESLKGVLLRYLSASDAPVGDYPSVKVANLPRPVVLAVWFIAVAGIAGSLLLTASDRHKIAARRVYEYPLLLAAILLVSPHNTRIYYCALFLPYVMLVIAARRTPPGRLARLLRLALWASCAVNTVAPAVAPGRAASLAYQAAAPFVFATLGAFMLLFALTRTPRLRGPR
jgi:hypothetical protein